MQSWDPTDFTAPMPSTFLLCWKLLDEQSYKATGTESCNKSRLGVPKPPPASFLTRAGEGSLKAMLFLCPHLSLRNPRILSQHLLLEEPELTQRVAQGL